MTCIHFLKIDLIFFRAVLGSQEKSVEGTEISLTPPLPHTHHLLRYQHPPTRVMHLLELMNLRRHVILTQSP